MNYYSKTTIKTYPKKHKNQKQNIIPYFSSSSPINPPQYIPLLLFRIEPSVPKTAKANNGLTSNVSKIGGIIFRNKFK